MKSGAEGVCAFALADGRAAAVKFDDGAQRPVAPLMATLLAADRRRPGHARAWLRAMTRCRRPGRRPGCGRPGRR